MSIRIEFYGVSRQRAGCESLTVAAGTAAEALRAALTIAPGLSDCVTPAGNLRAGYIVNLNGRRFLEHTEVSVSPGDTVLLLSADAGG